MNGIRLVLLLTLIVFISLPSYSDTLTGRIAEIVGQRVTVTNDKGEAITLTITQSNQLAIGNTIQIEYTQVGDALLASSVTIINQ